MRRGFVTIAVARNLGCYAASELPFDMPFYDPLCGKGGMMKAFVMKGIGSVGFTEKPVPEPGPFDTIVRTTTALICTSDSHTVQGGIGPRENLTLGHEAVGVVHAVGSEVIRIRPGDRVLSGAITPDWGDPASQNGFPSQSGGPLGGFKYANSKDGVFAEYFHVNDADANLAVIPDDVPDEWAVYCADMLSTGFMGAEKGNIPIGGTVAVLAQGPVGLMATAGSRLRGAGLIIGVESVPGGRRWPVTSARMRSSISPARMWSSGCSS